MPPAITQAPSAVCKAQRTRSVLAATAVVATVLAAGLALCLACAGHDASLTAHQQAGGTMVAPDAEAAAHAKTTAGKPQVQVPLLGELLGLPRGRAVALVGRGATQIDSQQVDAGAVRVRLTLALTWERSRDFEGAPRVYLGLDAKGRVCEAGFSAAVKSLGYRNDLTFEQAVEEAHLIQGALAAGGVSANEGQLALPGNRDAYCSYRDDGTTLVAQQADFRGGGRWGDTPLSWEATLRYDYAAAVLSGDLRDTVRVVTVRVAPA